MPHFSCVFFSSTSYVQDFNFLLVDNLQYRLRDSVQSQLHVATQFLQLHSLKGLSFPHVCSWHFVKNQLAVMLDLIPGSQLCGIFLCQYHGILATIALWYILK